MSGANYCSGSAAPQRTYVVTLVKRSIVFMSLISGKTGGGSFSGIGINGELCGYDFYPVGGSYSTNSATCIKKLAPGSYTFNYCIADASSGVRGSIVVLPNE